MGEIKETFKVEYNPSYIISFLKNNFNIKYGKPYRIDYRRSPYYKSTFKLNLFQKFRKYCLKYDENTGNIKDLKSNKKVLIYSFDESAFQFVGNYIKVISLTKPQIATDTNRYPCKAAGFYSLTPEGKDYITFMENSTKETIMQILKEISKQNPEKIIFLIIDNFSSHRADLVKKLVKELNIELCYLPPYSPQLQPIEKIWYKIKRDNMEYKIDNIKDFEDMDKNEKLNKLKEIVEKSFYHGVKSKNMWNKVLNNYIKPTIKKLHPRYNSNVKLEKVI